MEEPTGEQAASWKQLHSWLLTRTAEHAHRLVADGFAAEGATGHHYRLLATLEAFGPASQADVGRRSGIHTSVMVATVNELADRGLVERAPDPADGRRNVVSPTTAGRRHLRRLEKQLTASQEALLAPLSAEERHQLRALLTLLLTHHDQHTGDPEAASH